MLVDTELIVKMPPRLFAAGIADCIAAWEGYYNLKYANLLDEVDAISLDQLRRFPKIIEDNAIKAYEAVQKQEITHEFENAVSAMSFVNGAPYSLMGCFLCHLMDELFDTIPESRKLLHGERVGFGGLIQFVFVDNMEKFYDWLKLFQAIGLPCTLKDMGLENMSYDEFYEYCKKDLETGIFAKMPFYKFTAKELADATFKVDKLAKEYLSKKA